MTSLFLFCDLEKLTITGVAAIESSADLLCKCLEKIANDPINNLRVGSVEIPGNKLVKLAYEIIKICHNHPRCAETVFISTTKKIGEIMKHCDFKKVASKKEFWKSIHLFYLSAEAKCSWDSILAFIPDNNLIQLFPSVSISSLIIHEILHLENKNTPNGESQGDIVLSEEEQQVMRYVAGYIIYSLISKYKKICRTNSNQCVLAAMEFLCSLKSNGDSLIKCESFLDYTRKWTELVNRGGLIEVNDNLFIFVRRTEICVQKILNLELLKIIKAKI